MQLLWSFSRQWFSTWGDFLETFLVVAAVGDRGDTGDGQRCCYSAQDSPPQHRIIWPQISIVLRWRNPDRVILLAVFVSEGKKSLIASAFSQVYITSEVDCPNNFQFSLILSHFCLKSFNSLMSHSLGMANRVTSPQTSILVSASREVGPACVMYIHVLPSP